MKPIKIINGPNLNLLGLREPHIYGATTLPEVEQLCASVAAELRVEFEFHQSNHEGVIIDLIQDARVNNSGIILNPAGFTSTSIAIVDALLASELPVIEVHLTNLHKRDEWRHLSYVSKVASAIIAGAGPQGYELALRHMAVLAAK